MEGIPLGHSFFGGQVHLWSGVWQDPKCHGLEDLQLNVPHLKTLSCFVLCCSRCSADVFLFIQMFLYHSSILLYYVTLCTCVADVFNFKNLYV